MIPPTTEASSSPLPTLPTTPPKPRCFAQSLNLPISREQFRDKKLHGHVMWNQSVLSEVQCEDLCLRVPGCLAYNYHYSGRKGQKSCELMNEVAVVNDTLGYCFRLFERERALKVSICHLFRLSVLLTTPNLRRFVGSIPITRILHRQVWRSAPEVVRAWGENEKEEGHWGERYYWGLGTYFRGFMHGNFLGNQISKFSFFADSTRKLPR